MLDLKQQHETAKSAYEAAYAALNAARNDYENGPGKMYAEVKENALTLERQVVEQGRASQSAKAALAQALRKSNGAVTPLAKEALAQRRNADDLLDEYRELKAEMEVNTLDLHIAASNAASTYISLHATASRRWAEMNVAAALLACGETMARAMVVEPREGSLFQDQGSISPKVVCRDLVIAALDRLCEQFSDSTQPYLDEIGVVDLVGIARSEILTPGGMKAARARLSNANVANC